MTEAGLAHRWRSVAGPLFAFRAIGQGAEFLGWIILARRLGAAAFGQLSVAFLVCRYGGLVADWGATIRGVRDVAGQRGAAVVHALVHRRTQVTIVLSGLYLLGCWATGHLPLAPLVTVVAALGLGRDWLALGRERGARSAVPALVQGLTLAAAAILVSSPDQPAWPVALGYGAAATCSVALNRLPPRAAHEHAKVPVDGWMLLAIFMNQVMSSADTLLLALLVSTSDAGIYAAIYRIPNGWLAAVAILGSSLLPLSAGSVHDPARFDALRRGSLRVSASSAIVLIVAIPVVYLAVPFLFGPAYDAGQVPIVILLLATAIATAAAPLHHLFLAFGSDRSYATFLSAAAILNLAVNLALIPTFGMVGAATATLVANGVLATIVFVAVQRHVAARTGTVDTA